MYRFLSTYTNFVVMERRPVFNQLALRTPAHRVSEFMQVQTIGKWWRGHSRRIGLRYRSIYQTRHTYASWMLAVTGNLKFIAEQMGHTDLEMISKVYGAWMPDNSAKENSRIWQELSEKENTDSDPDNKVGITALNLP
ncbi:hypothetical protein GCM10023116_18840 [Kistimonas scapharcae]|uniref:Tyr recombinase domain-containing protein n=1 Tax=Kistimonas scapharcae TaxID=1036133 RepID=A0ABP8V218_9GAMM